MGSQPERLETRSAYKYKAFISYSHRDSNFGAILQPAIEKLAKPWYRRRAVSLFRDQTDLSANPNLWPRIMKAMDDSEYLLLLASPESAQSVWVTKELEYWKSTHGPVKLVIALISGEIIWDEGARDFDWHLTNAVSPALKAVLQTEPLWADFRSVDLRARSLNAAFREPVVRLAAGLRNVAPRELESEDLHQHRRAIRLATAASMTLLVLLIAALAATFQAIRQRDLARSRQLAALSTAHFTDDPELSVLLALRAREIVPTSEAEQALRAAIPLSHVRRTLGREDDEYLNSLSISSDGKRIATASGWSFMGKMARDLKARVWDVETGRVLATLPHPAPVSEVVLSPNGHVLLSLSTGVPRLWDVDSHNLIAALGTHNGGTTSIAISPDGKYVATGGSDGVVELREIGVDHQPLALQHADTVSDVAFSPDSAAVVTASGERKLLDPIARLFSAPERRFLVIVWDVRTGRERLRLPPFNAPVEKARFSPDGSRIVAVSQDNAARLWDIKASREIGDLRGHTDSITAVGFSADSRWLATASKDTTARVWDAKTAALRSELHGHKQGLQYIALTADGQFAVTAGADRFAIVWDVATGRSLGELRGNQHPITGLQLSSNEQFIATTSYDGLLRLWRIPRAALVENMGPAGAVEKMALSSDGERVLAQDADGRVSIWRVRTGTELAQLPSAYTNSRSAWSGNGNWVIVPASENRVLVYDARTGAISKSLVTPEGYFGNVAISPDGERVVALKDFASGGGRALTFWDVASTRLLTRVPVDMAVDAGTLEFSSDGARLKMTLFAALGSQLRDSATGALIKGFAKPRLRFSPSGRRILEIDGPDNVPHVYDSATGAQIAQLGSHGSDFRFKDALFAPDDRRVLAVDNNGKAVLWDVEGPHPVSTFMLNDADLDASIAVSRDGRFLALTGRSTVGIWDLRSGKKIRELQGHSDMVTTAAFTADGQALVTGSRDGTLRVYPQEAFESIDDLVKEARSVVSRQLSKAEALQLFNQ